MKTTLKWVSADCGETYIGTCWDRSLQGRPGVGRKRGTRATEEIGTSLEGREEGYVEEGDAFAERGEFLPMM